MINRVGRDYPDDSGHVRRLEAAGAGCIRGAARLDGPGRVVVTPTEPGGGPSATGSPRTLQASNVIVAVGSASKVPPVEGIGSITTWTNRDATSARQLPESLLVLGGGPTGVELAQVYARFGVPTTIVQSGSRLAPTDHPRNSEAARRALERDGVAVRLGVRALRAHAAKGTRGADVIELDDGTTAEGHVTLLAVGRTFPLEGLGLESVGLSPRDLPRDGRLRIGEGLWLVGDPAGPELHTHQGHYQGELAVRMALGDPVTPDYRALPRATYTDPELASVGLTLEQALAAGLDAFELVADFATSTKGYSVEAEFGHVTIVVDRASARAGRRRHGRARTPRPPSTSASWRSRPASRSTCWRRRSTPSRRRRASSTDSSPTPPASSAARWLGSRRLWTRLAGFALAGVLLGAVAAFVVRDRPSSDPGQAGATPTVTELASTADRSRLAPTAQPEPTRAAAAPPTPEPTERQTTSLAAFGEHVGAAIKEGAALLETLRGAAQAFDIGTVRSSSAALSAWATEESAWLDEHPPRRCYRSVHAEYASAIDDFGEAAAITERFADDFPFADFDDLQRAIDLANRGAASMEEAGRLVQEVDC